MPHSCRVLRDGNILPLLAGCDRRDEEGKQTVEEWLHGNNIVKPPATVKAEREGRRNLVPQRIALLGSIYHIDVFFAGCGPNPDVVPGRNDPSFVPAPSRPVRLAVDRAAGAFQFRFMPDHCDLFRGISHNAISTLSLVCCARPVSCDDRCCSGTAGFCAEDDTGRSMGVSGL